MSSELDISDVSKLLAVLVVEQGSYTYVDKLGYAPSTDLAIYYLKEAIRDYHSLLRKGELDHPELWGLIKDLNKRLDRVNYVLDKISEIRDRKELRKVVSLISSKALSFAAKYIKVKEEKEEE